MRPNIILILVVVFLAWGSLFITVLSQSAETHKTLKDDQVLLQTDATIIKKQNDTINILSGKVNDLQTHVDCLFNLATQPNPSNSHIANASTCLITHSAPSTSPASSQSPPNSTSEPKNTNSSGTGQGPQPTPQPKPSLECKLTLGLLIGC